MNRDRDADHTVPLKGFTRADLAKFDGSVEGRPILVACGGWVYDVTGSSPWHKGRHWACAHAGRDETRKLSKAPHGPEMLARVPRVGRMIDA